MNKWCKSEDLDFEGACFGLIYLDDVGAPEGCVELYLEDDETWHYKATFNHFWISDLENCLKEARKHFNC